MSVCVSSAGGTLGVDAMSLSQMTLPSSMMLPLAHSTPSLGSHSSSLLGQPSLGTIGSALDGGSSVGGSSRGLQHNSSGCLPPLPGHGAHDGQSSSLTGAALSGDLADHHPNPEMLLALISRNKALEGLVLPKTYAAPACYGRSIIWAAKSSDTTERTVTAVLWSIRYRFLSD
uniref:Uncharacterized protein n=1 Tax=Anopheles farauti TaxID=69004 RepID=A0A182QH24_9DIPT